jgi:hypothetical protein
MDAEQTVDPADDAAHHAADKSPHRTSRVRPDVSTMGYAVWNALCLCRERTSERRS